MVQHMREGVPPALDTVRLDTMLHALGDPVRLEILRQLVAAEGVVDGSFDVAVTMSTLSHHLKVLLAGGLVRVSRQGRYRRCELRLADVEDRFPGLLPAVLTNITTPPAR